MGLCFSSPFAISRLKQAEEVKSSSETAQEENRDGEEGQGGGEALPALSLPEEII